MANVRIGILKEGKIPVDRRVPITPLQVEQVKAKFPELEIVCQSSPVRCFLDEEYPDAGIPVVEEVDECSVLLGVKEVPIKDLLENKTYFFFSHTIKKQAYNRKLLQAILQKNIRLIDYECLTDNNGTRLIAFGRFAGIVGAYNGLLTYGLKHNFYDLRRARDCFDLKDLKTEFSKVKLPPTKIVLTGGGRVAKGAIEVLEGMHIKFVSPDDFLNNSYDHAVYTQLRSKDYHYRIVDDKFDSAEFYKSPEKYRSDFIKYTAAADLLIAAAYWHPSAPVLFTKEDMQKETFRINVIADISCDIEGSIPSTKRPSTIDDPVYDYNPWEDRIELPFSGRKFISVMAVDNLPCELSRDASREFGNEMINKILPCLLGADPDNIIGRATIAEDGHLTQQYSYLQSYVDEA